MHSPIWKKKARADLANIVQHIALDNPDAADALADEIEAKAAKLTEHPRLYKPGRMKGTREMVVRPNYVVVYQDGKQAITILRVLHTAQQWP